MIDNPCFLQCGVNCNSAETISTKRWKKMETETKDWKSLDKFRNVFESADWEKEAEGIHIYEKCYITLSSKLPFQQSRKRKGERKCWKNSKDA